MKLALYCCLRRVLTDLRHWHILKEQPPMLSILEGKSIESMAVLQNDANKVLLSFEPSANVTDLSFWQSMNVSYPISSIFEGMQIDSTAVERKPPLESP